jgi:hypothetical protein
VGLAMKPSTLLLGVALSFSGQSGFAQADQTQQYSQKTLLKNWALSRCLAQAYTDESAKTDANAAASAYLESGKQSIEVYSEINSLVERYLNKSYRGSIASDFNTMKCVDLFHGAELERIVSKAAKLNK